MMPNLLPALIVAHGQPSDPAPAARDLDALAQRVAQVVQVADGPGEAGQGQGRQVRGATLAQAGALEAALQALGPRGLVYPLFMAGGWFTRVALADRLRAAGGQVGPDGWQVLEPFGCDAAVHDLACSVVAQALTGQRLAQAQVLVAAHGSFKSSAPSDVAYALAQRLRDDLGLLRAEARFIDQAPQLAGAQGFGAGAICLPFFAASGGHVLHDIPAALAQAQFGGRVLPPLGLHPQVPSVIAAALAAAKPVCAQSCRFTPPPVA